MNPGIHRASVADIEELLPLVRAYWDFEQVAGFEKENVRRSLRELFSNRSLGLGLVCRDNSDQLVAYLLGVFVFSLEHLGLTAEIDELFVAEGHRSAGLGRKLLLAAEKEFTRLGCTNVSLQVARDNDAARRFYQGSGYADRPAFGLMEKDLR
ncbi:MAG: GNAT family N-acetyltransferase [Woeseiaceae bacterium]|nr:GNAT family N-acetyltransferase [Woeseiaceae bacterium]